MKNLFNTLLLSLLLWVGGPASAQVSIGINIGLYPAFVRVPNYPVYYAPRLQTNFFFYDGMYWVFEGDTWYASDWYNGPWWLVEPQAVPLYVLRIPVRYYRRPPVYFRSWQPDAPPRWGEHWGNDWSQQRRGWDRWDRRAAPAPAPLPVYQRQYSGQRYPRIEQQRALQSRNYRYQPRDAVVQQRAQAQAVAPAPAAPVQRAQQPASDRGAGPSNRSAEQRQPPPSATARREPLPPAMNQHDTAPGRADSPRPRPEQAPGQAQGQGQDKGKKSVKPKGQDKDREDSDAPGQQRKKEPT